MIGNISRNSCQALIVISTYNRKDLTGLTIDIACRRAYGIADVLVLDDCSVEYNEDWLHSLAPADAPLHVHRFTEPQGVGAMAHHRYRLGVEYCRNHDIDTLVMIDNDALFVRPRPIETAIFGLQHAVYQYSHPVILSLFRSRLHPAIMPSLIPSFDQMGSIGGINHCCTVSTAEKILQIPQRYWTVEWDWILGNSQHYTKSEELARMTNDIVLLAPERSFIEHIGRYGGGVNGYSADYGVNVWEQ